jgi:hypothetical protein
LRMQTVKGAMEEVCGEGVYGGCSAGGLK